MSVIVIEDNKCWLCGKIKPDLTKHHTLPKHLKPSHNVIVPLCEKCHSRVTAEDVVGMYAYAYKLEKSVMFLGEQVKGIKVAIENKFKIKLKNEKKEKVKQ